MVAIRADANETIATGHLMRCMSIADELLKKGEQVLFLVADSFGEALTQKRGFDVVVLNSQWDDLDSELKLLEENIDKYSIDCIILDSYYVTFRYMEQVSRWVRLVYLDDMLMFPYPCHVLLNYSIYAEEMNYSMLDIGIRQLLGCKYVPLRREFFHLPPKVVKRDLENVLLLTGGSDTCHVALQFCRALNDCGISHVQNAEIHVVCGRYSEDIKELQEMKKYNPKLRIYANVQNIAELMKDADIAISAGGSTLYELSACGTPTITYSLADNQLKNVQAFNKKNLMEYFGDVRQNMCYERLLDALGRMAENYTERKEKALRLQQLVDGNGAARIVRELMDNF